ARRGASLVITWHEFWGSSWAGYLPPLLATAARQFERGLPRLATANVAVSPFTAARLRQGAGVLAHVVPHGIDLATIRSPPPTSLTTDVIYVGRLIKEKRVPLLLDAIRRLACSVPQLTVEIIGDGPEKDAVYALAQSMPANVHLRLLLRVDEPRELYSR